MKIFLSFLLIFSSIISIFCVIPEWNLDKAGEELLSSSSDEYSYTTIERLMFDVYLKMTRKIKRENNIANYTNELYMSYNFGHIVQKEVPFDFVESFYLINDNYIVCPKGPYHPYNFDTGEYVEVDGFEKKGLKDWDLKCFKHENNGLTFFLVFYLMNGNITLFYTTYGEYNWGKMVLADELYDYKLENAYYYRPDKEREYAIMPLMKDGNNFALIGKVIYLKSDTKNQYTPGESQNLTICSIKTFTQAYYSNFTNSFYFITYDDIYNFVSGYVITDSNDKTVNNFNWANGLMINNISTPFEFIEKEFEIEQMNIMLYNRFVYYKIKEKNSEKLYHGILDIITNKVIFNTNEKINYFIPYSNISMLAITPTNAYKICFYKNNDECVEECQNGYKYDVDGNTCSDSSACSDNKITMIPSGICIDSCDQRYYFYDEEKNQCGLCRDFNPTGNSYKLVNGTNCIGFDETSMEYYNEDLKLIKCKENYTLKDNDCVYEKECYELCEKGKCTKNSDDINNQYCTSCIDGYYLENGNCKVNCSNGYEISGKECVGCADNFCDIFIVNTCNCTKCKFDNYFINTSNSCEECDKSCLKCEGDRDLCTECDKSHFLFDSKCIDCATNCSETDSDKCKCKKCNAKFYLKDFLCYNCIGNCTTCTNSSKCDKCDNNYFVNDEGTCSPCPLNCKEREADNCQCKACDDHFFLKDKACIKCDDNCKTCEINSDHCTTCEFNYFLNEENNECVECSTNCKTCDKRKDNCTTCNDRKYLTKENKCENCSEKCKTCDNSTIDGNDHCLTCDNNSIYKYLINDDNNKTCVENCTTIGREFNDDYTMCVMKNKTSGDPEKNNDTDYLLWIFIVIIGIIIIIITICIVKKIWCSKDSGSYIQEISTELEEKALIKE